MEPSASSPTNGDMVGGEKTRESSGTAVEESVCSLGLSLLPGSTSLPESLSSSCFVSLSGLSVPSVLSMSLAPSVLSGLSELSDRDSLQFEHIVDVSGFSVPQ